MINRNGSHLLTQYETFNSITAVNFLIFRGTRFFRNDHVPWCELLSHVFEESIIFKLWRDTKYL